MIFMVVLVYNTIYNKTKIMELIVSYLIYILGVIVVVAIIALARVKIHAFNTRAELLKVLIEKGYETDNIDINNYI